MGLTTNFKIPYPEDNDVANVPGDLKKLAEKTDESLKSLIDLIYPVGRGFIDFTNTDYSNWLGLTWERELLGMFPVGYNPNDTDFNAIGNTGGEKTHTLTEDEMPSHKGHLYDNGESANWGSAGENTYYMSTSNLSQYSTNRPYVVRSGNELVLRGFSRGANQPHNNLPPYQVVSYWKRVESKVSSDL